MIDLLRRASRNGSSWPAGRRPCPAADLGGDAGRRAELRAAGHRPRRPDRDPDQGAGPRRDPRLAGRRGRRWRPAPVTPEAIDALFDHWPIFEAFQSRYFDPAMTLDQEKNG